MGEEVGLCERKPARAGGAERRIHGDDELCSRGGESGEDAGFDVIRSRPKNGFLAKGHFGDDSSAELTRPVKFLSGAEESETVARADAGLAQSGGGGRIGIARSGEDGGGVFFREFCEAESGETNGGEDESSCGASGESGLGEQAGKCSKPEKWSERSDVTSFDEDDGVSGAGGKRREPEK